jgi:hypothetical protein
MGLIQTIKRLMPDAIIIEVEDYKSVQTNSERRIGSGHYGR